MRKEKENKKEIGERNFVIVCYFVAMFVCFENCRMLFDQVRCK
jgi:hypothetical protein